MKGKTTSILGLIGVALLLVLGCAAPSVVKEAPVVAPPDSAPQTLAILPFENNSITDRARYEPLSKGLSAMLITDLNQSGTALRLIERGKIQSLLKEIALSQTGSVDESTAIRAGKILGAQNIAFGSFVVLADNVRIDIRIVKVETSALVKAESIMGAAGDFMSLERGLAQKIANSLRVAFSPKGAPGDSGLDAALLFSQGLEAMDRGDRSEADRLFGECVEIDPTYKAQVDSIGR